MNFLQAIVNWHDGVCARCRYFRAQNSGTPKSRRKPQISSVVNVCVSPTSSESSPHWERWCSCIRASGARTATPGILYREVWEGQRFSPKSAATAWEPPSLCQLTSTCIHVESATQCAHSVWIYSAKHDTWVGCDSDYSFMEARGEIRFARL